MGNLIRTILFILGGIIIFGMVIIFLPVLILLYLLLPKSTSKTWFTTFAQQARPRGFQQNRTDDIDDEPAEPYSNEIPASQDVIDVSAEEVEDKENK